MATFGLPLRIPNRSLTSILLVEPTLGIDVSQPSVDAPLGSTPSADNYIMRESALEQRPGLRFRTTNQQPMGSIPITGGRETTDVLNNRYPLISGTTRLAWLSNGSWSVLSYVSAGGVNDQPAGSSTSYWDMTQVYYDIRDENIAIMANGSYQSLYAWQSGTTLFSTLTGAPRAQYVTTYDNYVVAFNIRDSGSVISEYPQRVQWSDRGSASSWTGGLSGFEDLLAMRGTGTRIIAQDNRLILFSDAEIWQGFPSNFPFVFRFEPLDRSVGCPYPWTIAETPHGLMFMGRDLEAHLLPKDGGTAQSIGRKFHRDVRETIDVPERAWGVYDQNTKQYQLYYAKVGQGGLPAFALYLDMETGSWAPQSFTGVNLTRGFPVTGLALTSSATSWGGAGAAGMTWANTSRRWGSFNTRTTSADRRDVFIGDSTGQMYYLDSTATNDEGRAIACHWQSTALFGEIPDKQKTVTEWRVDYQGNSSSSLTVRFSQNQGMSFDQGIRLNLPATSGISQAILHTYTPARFPMFKIESEGYKCRLFRFWVQARIGGR